MPRKIREIKYHPSADLTEASVILKSAYTGILQNIKKAIRKSNFSKSQQELQKISHSCQTELDNTIKNLKKEAGLAKEHTELIDGLIEDAKSLFNKCATLPQFPLSAKMIDDDLKKIRQTSKPSPTFFKLIQSLNKGQESRDKLSQVIKEARQSIHHLETVLKTAKTTQRHAPFVIGYLNQFIPRFKTYIDELDKLVKAMNPPRRLRVILRQANQLKEIFNEKGQI